MTEPLAQSPKPVVLLVDDQPRNLQLLGTALYQNGYDVALAASGQEALELIRESPPDLVLLDVMMAGMNGFEVCRTIKDSQFAPDLEVIFITAKTQKEDILAGFTAGGVDYITKPIQIPEVLARVKSQISLKLARDSLRAANCKLSKVIENQQHFLSILSHDVRAPLYGLNHLLSEALESAGELEKEDLVEMIRTCEDSSRRLSVFFEDALIWARNEAGGFEENAVAFSVNDVFCSVESLLLPLFKKKQVELVASIPAGTAVLSLINAFSTVIRNLLSNAVKYSRPGGRVTFQCEPLAETIRVAITDKGIGMSKERLDSLFLPEKRQSTLGTGNEKGSGVGLILCQSLVQKMGGTLQVESEEGNGSRFSFEVPRFKDQEASEPSIL